MLQAALLPAFGSAGLAVKGSGDWAPVAALQVQPAAQALVPAVAALQQYAPGIWLRGFALAGGGRKLDEVPRYIAPQGMNVLAKLLATDRKSVV